MDYVQAPPNCIQIEATEGCTIACQFCGIRGIRAKPNSLFKYLTPDLAQTIANRIKASRWNPRLEFAMHGEPSANPDLVGIIRIFRRTLPNLPIMVTSNGMPMVQSEGGLVDYLDRLWRAGCNTVALDNYQGMKAAGQLRAVVAVGAVPGHIVVGEYPKDTNFNPHARPTKRYLRKLLRVCIIEDIAAAAEGNHAHLSNHAGASGPKDHSMNGTRCALPFRELSIRWDGNVALCCNDWRGEYKIGNVTERDLRSIWHDPRMHAMRKKLYHGERDVGPCDGCTHKSFRIGLLPDPKGNETLPEPDAVDLGIIKDALAGDPYTPPVRRVWETGDGRPQPGVIDGKVRMITHTGEAK